ncbi:aliphatic sulfonate ABC transporter substrate-binding protein [Rhizobium rhizogenes]|uniref:Putative aliphatic sulfonates-binding protein n=1 Tax=Rhizobium rhizogenes TaxID=359 RepID=A0AA92C1R4_RHIRH|nr:aliphatic sulfonate ABC transporter substrate-binding protein [Rhizobium rhizogenes]PVE52494.1 aliphatic sulfonates ABC transporter substrate-binding protein [Rhizobium rhizogenes]PVE63145.1 aliphatic sulfonates ABC transporter substrate-binding protein [Agrobacterium tumefaciens]PVE72038.1 aliphatic sulfonates ABC transporter substrate-binding protein [Sphingomonas sp. TPD3009]
MFTKRKLLSALVVAASVTGLIPAAQAADQTIRIGWLRGPNDITLAKSRGTLEKALAEKGIKIEWAGPFPAAAPAFEALNAGSIDITAGSSTSAIAALSAKIPLVIFAYQKMSPGAEGIVVKKDSGIASIKDLAGKKVAVNRGGTGEYLLMQGLQTNGVDPKSVERVYLSPSDSGPSFTQGHVDAWATWDPFLTIAETAYDGKVVADGAAIKSDNAVVLVASKEFATSKADQLQLVFDVIKSENAWAVANKEEAGTVWVKEMNVPSNLAAKIGENNAVPTTSVTDADVKQIGAVAEWYAKSGIIPALPNVKDSVVSLK